jgi:hypothetical protein
LKLLAFPFILLIFNISLILFLALVFFNWFFFMSLC